MKPQYHFIQHGMSLTTKFVFIVQHNPYHNIPLNSLGLGTALISRKKNMESSK